MMYEGQELGVVERLLGPGLKFEDSSYVGCYLGTNWYKKGVIYIINVEISLGYSLLSFLGSILQTIIGVVGKHA